MDTNVSPTLQKLLVGGVLFAAWSYLVFTGKVSASDYVENVKIALGGLGMYHVATAPARAATKAANDAAQSVVDAQPAAPAPTTIVSQ
jgi:hypothetical protein